MSDTRLRSRERASAASGAPADRVACLLTRVRHGETSPDGLRFASYLGDPAARETLRRLGLRVPRARFLHGAWKYGMPCYDGLAPTYAIACGQRIGAALIRATATLLPGDPRAVLASVRYDRWILEQQDSDRRVALRLAEGLRREAERPLTARLLGRRLLRRPPWILWESILPALWPDIHVNCAPHAAASNLARILGLEPTQRALTNELLPWALGDPDPLAAHAAP